MRRNVPSPADMPGANQAVTRDDIDFHRGNILFFVANTYRTVPATILEMIQNGFDAGADRILVCVDLKRHEVLVLDNGLGTDREMFKQALTSVAQSVKNQDKKQKQLGRFGLGLLSPLTKCSFYTFTSSLRGQRKALRWTFKRADIAAQSASISVPVEQLDRGMPALPRRFAQYSTGEFGQHWRTEVHLHGLTDDRIVSAVDLDELAFNIRTKFMAPMRERKALVRLVLIDSADRHVSVDVDPLQYLGEPLPVVSYHGDDAGDAKDVELELFRARRTGGQRKGKVSVMATESNYPLTMVEFVRQARARGVQGIISAAMEALSSGYFEGIIRCSGIELDPERTKFVFSPALEDLYLVLDRWYTEYGRSQYQTEQDVSRHVRWQELGLQTLALLQDRQHQPHWAQLLANLRDVVELGRLGVGHLPPDKGRVDGPDGERSKRVGQGGVGVPRDPQTGTASSGSGATERQRSPATRDGDFPKTSAGPEGRARRMVKGDSQGLQLAHAEWPGDSRLWTFDHTDGTITFNTLHPVWIMLDETNGKHHKYNAEWIVRLQMWLVLQVLNLLQHFPDREEFERYRGIIDTQVRHFAEIDIMGNRRR